MREARQVNGSCWKITEWTALLYHLCTPCGPLPGLETPLFAGGFNCQVSPNQFVICILSSNCFNKAKCYCVVSSTGCMLGLPLWSSHFYSSAKLYACLFVPSQKIHQQEIWPHSLQYTSVRNAFEILVNLSVCCGILGPLALRTLQFFNKESLFIIPFRMIKICI